ncbi:MAG: cytochrome c peroxidase [Bacteroidota bacterium]|nr:cytochrome c peroxidase [Bacteroidota bacterium]
MRKILIYILVILTLNSCKKDKQSEPSQTTPYELSTPYGFANMIIPQDNLLTVEGVSLGEKLFNDPILSGDNTLSCAGCHIKTSAFSDPNQFSTGINNMLGIRNASAIINPGWHSKFNWDGSANSLEEQAFEPVTNPKEMNETWSNVEAKLNTHNEYPELFKNAFNINYIDSTHVVKALAQFERTLISAGNSRYDQYLRNEIQLTPSELNGFAIFITETGDCFHCHGTEMFMDNLFHNNALDNEPFMDNGLGEITGNIQDNGKFKTPTLRNIEFSSPYMHDGRFETLEEVIDHYSSGLQQSTTVDPLMKKLHLGGLQLTNQEKEDLISFLKTLSDPVFITE